MHPKDPIRMAHKTSLGMVETYLADLSDDELLFRPVEGMNPIAWQLGHLLISERQMLEFVSPGSSPPLPDGFADAYGRETPEHRDHSHYATKAEYLDLLRAQRAASASVLESISDAELDAPGPPKMASYAPTKGAVLLMIGMHQAMHIGQFVAVRRTLNKPVVI